MKRLAFVVLASAAFGRIGFGQGHPQRAPEPAPANAWMRVPSDVTSVDRVPASVRRTRDDYWDSSQIGRREPLTRENVGSSGLSEGSIVGDQPEIFDVPERALLIGTFDSSRSILSASRRSIYTEVYIRWTHVFEDIGEGTRAGSKITVVFPGGTVRTSGGDILSYITQPRKYFVAPGKAYLLLLEYHPEGDFYIFGRDWDLSDGTVRADDALEARRAAAGGSTLVGLTTANLTRVLDQRFSVPQH